MILLLFCSPPLFHLSSLSSPPLSRPLLSLLLLLPFLPSSIISNPPNHHIHSDLGSSVSIMDIIPACAITAGGIVSLAS